MTISNTTPQAKCRRYMSIVAWQTLQERDREYALNLAIAGPWIDEDNKERDGYGNLDARYGSERCQETALICAIAISTISDFLDKTQKRDMAIDLVHKYRAAHKNDKRWMDIYELDDISTANPAGYNALKQEIFNSMNPKLVKYLGWSRTINSFSVLTRNEHGIALKYRRARDVLVATTEEDKDMGECRDMDYPLRVLYSELNFDLMEELATSILPEGVDAAPFVYEPRSCDTIVEQLREVYHFSARYKMVAGQYPIKIGLFSASFEILLRAAWKHNIPITVCMPRLRYHTEQTNSTQYWMTSAPVLTYLPSQDQEGLYEVADEDYLREHGLDKKASWRMSGYSMYSNEDSGHELCSRSDQVFIDELKQSNIVHLLSIFGFAHNEYPEGSTEGKYKSLDLIRAVCPEKTSSVTSEWRRDLNGDIGYTNLLDLYNAYTTMASETNISDSFIARQRESMSTVCYDMQAKSIPYTFNHVEVSTYRQEQHFWNTMVERHRMGGPTYRHIFIVGNEAYSMADQSTADQMMKTGNDSIKVKTLLDAHPHHRHFVRQDHLERYERSMKSKAANPMQKKAMAVAENERRAAKNKEKREKREREIKAKKVLEESDVSSTTFSSIVPVIISRQDCMVPCRSSAMIPIDIPRMVVA